MILIGLIGSLPTIQCRQGERLLHNALTHLIRSILVVLSTAALVLHGFLYKGFLLVLVEFTKGALYASLD